MPKPAKYRRVTIDRQTFIPAEDRPLDEEARNLLASVYDVVGAEAFYDPNSQETRRFAASIYPKLKRLNELLEFRA